MDASTPPPDAEPRAAAPVADSTRVASSEGPPRSFWHRLTATRARRGSLLAGVLVAFVALAYIVATPVGPRPDATLQPVADKADGAVLSMLFFLGADTEQSTIRGFQPYRGIEPWFHKNTQGYQCFMLIQRSGPTVDGANCVPPGVDLFADIGAWPVHNDDSMKGLPDGSVIRFHYRGNSVDVFVYPASKAG